MVRCWDHWEQISKWCRSLFHHHYFFFDPDKKKEVTGICESGNITSLQELLQNFTSSKFVMMYLHVVSVPVLKASLIWNTHISGIYKLIENPYLSSRWGPEYDGGVRNRIFTIPLQTDVVLKPFPV